MWPARGRNKRECLGEAKSQWFVTASRRGAVTPSRETSRLIDLEGFPFARATARLNFWADLRERVLAMATKTGICARE
jgi:hypothetical protein